jgi:hypothetical protein
VESVWLQLNKSIVNTDLETLANQLRKTASEIPNTSDVSVAQQFAVVRQAGNSLLPEIAMSVLNVSGM